MSRGGAFARIAARTLLLAGPSDVGRCGRLAPTGLICDIHIGITVAAAALHRIHIRMGSTRKSNINTSRQGQRIMDAIVVTPLLAAKQKFS